MDKIIYKIVFGSILLFIMLTPQKTFALFIFGEKPLGLAGAYSAVADDTGAILLNPAGMSQIRAFYFDISNQTDKLLDTSIWGISILDSQTIALATGFAYYKMKRNDDSLSEEEELFALALAEMYRPGFMVGLTIKHIKQKNPNKKDYTGDVGILYYFDPKLSLAMVGKNLIRTDFEEVHKLFTAGLSYKTNVGLGFSFDLTKDADVDIETEAVDGKEPKKQKDTIYSFGAELLTPDGVKLRGGYLVNKIENKSYYGFNMNYSSGGYSLGYAVLKDEADKDNIIQNISLKLYY